MGHLTLKQGERLRKRMDRNVIGAPPHPALQEILAELFSPEEAEIAVRMPLAFASTGRLSRILDIPKQELEPRLDAMADRGLLIDIRRKGRVYWYLNPPIIGFFEFSMMRVRPQIDQKKLAEKLHEYLHDDPVQGMLKELSAGDTCLMRPLVHEDALDDAVVEVLDWERATHIVETATAWTVGLCYCRHVAEHRGEPCKKAGLETCLSFGPIAEHLARRGTGRAITKDEAMAILLDSRRRGLVQLGDNVQENVVFICNCCSCCCEMLEAYRRLKETPALHTSNYIATAHSDLCIGCGICEKTCPVEALAMTGKKDDATVKVNEDWCIGCGACATLCPRDAITMTARPARVHTPKNTLERVVRMAVERGKLQELIFDEPDNITHRVMRGLLGTLLALPPAKQLLAREQLKSRFVDRFLALAKHKKGTDAV